LRELETFARFGAELEPQTRRRLDRGRRLRETLKQPRLDPWRLGHEMATLFAIREGFLDAVALEQVGIFLDALRRYLNEIDRALLDLLEREGELDDAVQGRLRQALDTVRRGLPPPTEAR